ncbi:hypothetical protein FHS50_002066 [Sphingomicrobium lutaoense]|uniref:Uncharacterized protein n=1 Tax=Sphingomicrobium lutaoense TaxID=515949 RepID=A0A839Z7X0_9SPHN|nr:hypothetical protein [Sphingomicrobium lutaoense]
MANAIEVWRFTRPWNTRRITESFGALEAHLRA